MKSPYIEIMTTCKEWRLNSGKRKDRQLGSNEIPKKQTNVMEMILVIPEDEASVNMNEPYSF